MSHTFRPAELADAAAIAQLGASVFAKTFGYATAPDDLEYYLGQTYTPPAISAEIENPQRTIFIAVDPEGHVRGFTTLAYQTTKPCVEAIEGAVELQRMYVDTTTHGRGIGWGLLQCAVTTAVERGYKSMWLSSFSENQPTRQSYERWGFRKVGDEDFHIGNTVHHDIIMVKALG